VSCLGIALLQTFRTQKNADSHEHAHFAFRLSAAWIITVVEGLLVFAYGFLGFWLGERKRYFWRINLNCTTKYEVVLIL